MTFLGLGKKKKEGNVAKALETLPTDVLPTPLPMPVPDVSSAEPKPSLESLPVKIPEEVSIPNIDSEEISLPQNQSSNTDLKLEKLDPSKEVPFDALPDFSEDDFSAPTAPPVTSDKQSKNVVSENIKKTNSSVDKSSLFAPAVKTSKTERHSFGAKSYAASEGVFVSRNSYISLLDSLKESSKNVSSLKARQKHFVDFDLSMKKIFDKEANEFEKLHTDILAIVPFVTKK